MPKKHRPSSLNTKPQSSAPSTLRNGAAAPASPSKDGPSVNEALQRLRISHGLRPIDVSAQVQGQVSGSVHPSLRPILDIPTISGPSARQAVRGPGTPRVRRIPGPPPPASWSVARSSRAGMDRVLPMPHQRPSPYRIQEHSARLPGGRPFPNIRSLQHYSLKALAASWKEQTVDEYRYIAKELSVAFKELLLSYIVIYNKEVSTVKALHLLFRDDAREVTRLDLSNQIAPPILGVETVGKALVKYWDSEMESVSEAQSPVPETWDSSESEDTDGGRTGFLLPAQFIPRPAFKGLLHLSLAMDPQSKPKSIKCWSQLLKLTAELRTLQSLSLAYWPIPCMTQEPRAIDPDSDPVPLDLSIPYSSDWKDAPDVLRSLSRSLYCLKWLDLTGCGDWIGALVCADSEDTIIGRREAAPEWNGSWRGIEYLCLGVGWTPHCHSRSNKKEQIRHALETWDVEEERDKYYYRQETKKYMSLLDTSKKIAGVLRRLRASHGGKRIEFDFGKLVSQE